jgi:hypothetical protein
VNCSDRDNVEEDKSNKRIFQNVEIEIHLVKNKKNKKNRKIIFYFSFEHFLVTDSKACLPNLFNDLKGFCLFTDTDICRTKINPPSTLFCILAECEVLPWQIKYEPVFRSERYLPEREKRKCSRSTSTQDLTETRNKKD